MAVTFPTDTTALTSTTVASGDLVPIADISNSNNLKEISASNIAEYARITNATALGVYCVDFETDLVASTSNPVMAFHAPYACTLTAVPVARTFTAATGANLLTVDVHKNASTIFSTKLTLDASELTSSTAATAGVLSNSTWAAGDLVEIFVDQIGNTLPGTGLTVTFTVKPT